MENQKTAADRIRHVLNAMERGIDAARQRRVVGVATTASVGPVNAAVTPAAITPIRPAAASQPTNPAIARPILAPSQTPAINPLTGAPKLKAKPKRSSPFLDAGPPTYRSQAG